MDEGEEEEQYPKERPQHRTQMQKKATVAAMKMTSDITHPRAISPRLERGWQAAR